ncbi:MAG TPA: LysM peptidoglycan-binding domain-containing protein, partial [Sediminispirochaeta sp.]|nr:LysM peptidoglycan-binding domain-containing protein [Sediminispirochaeta sp.]
KYTLQPTRQKGLMEKAELLRRQRVKSAKLKIPPTMRIELSNLDPKYFLLVLASLLLLLVTSQAWSRLKLGVPSFDSEQIALPESDRELESELLALVGTESEARGSGDFDLTDPPIVKSVETMSYTVQVGDTLSEISSRHNIDVGTLISFNKIEDVRRLQAGSKIKIPDIDGVPHQVKRGESLEKIARKYNVSFESILDANDLQSAMIHPGQQLFIPGASIDEYDYKKAMGTLFIYPTSGRLTSAYGYRNDPFTGVRRMHYGIDLASRVGTDIVATMDGTVVTVGNQINGYGRYVVLKHDHGFQSLYGHLSTISVKRNQYVRQGQKIGEMGNSGRSTGPHLHFSLYKNNVPVNPLGGYLYK